MSNDSSHNSAIEVEASAKFQRDLRILAKRYRQIRKDIQPTLDQLQAGETPGDQIPGVGYTLFKVRVKNSNIQKGKSGGYRLIYYLKTSDKIILITIYSKSDQSTVTVEQIRAIIAEHESLQIKREESQAELETELETE